MKHIKLFFVLLLIFSFSSNAFAVNYVVQKGDTISGILYNKVPGRIYGADGNLSKLEDLNTELGSVDKIFPGSVIVLPEGTGEYTQAELASGLDVQDRTSNFMPSKNLKDSSSKKIEIKKEGIEELQVQKPKNQSLDVNLLLSYESLKSTDTSSGASEIATSDLSYGLDLRWSHHWKSNLNFFVESSLTKLKYNVASDTSLQESNFTKASGGVGLNYKLSNNHRYELSIGVKETMFLTSVSTSVRKIDKLVLPSLSFSGDHVLKRFESGFLLNAFWGLDLLMSSSQTDYNTDMGTSWSLGAGSMYEHNGNTFNISASYGQRSVGTDSLDQSAKEFVIHAGVGFDF